MNKYYLLVVLLYASTCHAQVNNGGTIIIQQGAVMLCAGTFNNATGVVNNDGKLEVQGSLLNTGTYNTPLNHDSVLLSGNINTMVSTGSTPFQFLTINKDSDTATITLGTSISIVQKFDYLSGKLSTDYSNNPSFSVTAPASAVFNFVGGHEIVGNVKRTNWVNGAITVFNSSNMQVVTNGGTAPATMMTTVLPGGNPSQAEREVKRSFFIFPTGGNGYTTDVRFPYQATELSTNTETNILPWYMASSEWNAIATPVTRDLSNHWVAITGVDITTISTEWKLADPHYRFNVTAFLTGSWNGSSMNASLNSILPVTQPYNGAPFNYPGTETVPSIPNNNIVDWVLIELRKPATGQGADAASGTIIGRKAGFLLTNGQVTDLDGVTPIAFDIAKQGGSFITIRHRNHLGVMSNLVPSDTIGTFANDFTIVNNCYTASANNPVAQLSGGIQYGLWPGDANQDGIIDIDDVNAIKVGIASSLAGYRLNDCNLSASVNATDLNIVKKVITASGAGGMPARTTMTTISTNIPDGVKK